MQHDVHEEHGKSRHEQERDYIATAVSSSERPLHPDKVAEEPEEKQLGVSAQSLTLNDFELLKTLGTGSFSPSHSNNDTGLDITN